MQWIQKRHQRTYKFFAPFFKCALRRRNFTYSKHTLPSGSHFIISNHLTKADQFMLSIFFGKLLYFVMRDDLSSLPVLGKIINYLVAPIPKSKVHSDIATIRIAKKIAKEGGNIMLFPEGNLSFDGRLCDFSIATSKFAKLLNIPIAVVNIEGGYGAMPRWCNKRRKGYLTAEVKRIISVEEYSALTSQQLYDLIRSLLDVDNFNAITPYVSSARAEYLETLLYVCPHCGFTQFVSKGNFVTCNTCKRTWQYTPNLTFEPPVPFKNTGEWHKYQLDYLQNIDYSNDKPIFTDTIKALKLKIAGGKNRRKKLFGRSTIQLYFNKIVISFYNRTQTFNFSDISSIAMLGRNRIELLFCDADYFIVPTKRLNSVKVINFFDYYKAQVNIDK
ncbi:MAG: lysophospholipid acyltransferase family protein [Clostridia bacterium]